MASTGRNEPCPCGSGKKYKHCCEGRSARIIPFPGSEQTARPATDSGSLLPQEILEALENQNFASLEEAKAFMETQVHQYNQSGIDDFLGWSPQRLSASLHGGEAAFDRFCSVRPDLSQADLTSIPILNQAWILLHLVDEQGPVKATTTGRLPRAVVQQWWKAVMATAKDIGPADSLPSREDYALRLPLVRSLCQKAGLLSLRSGNFSLTAKGRKLLAAEDYSAVYELLFRAAAWKVDWNDHSRYFEIHPIIQDSLLFTIHLLQRVATDWLGLDELFSVYYKAFPMISEDYPAWSDPQSRSLIQHMIAIDLSNYPRFFGIIETDKQHRVRHLHTDPIRFLDSPDS